MRDSRLSLRMGDTMSKLVRMLFCDVCDRKIIVEEGTEFNYTEDGGGPYCDVCWFFIERIQTLEERINDLERTTAPLRTKKHPSPYDAGARRVGSPQR